MALLKQWRDMAYDQEANKGDIQRFWAKYFDIEKGIYEQLLADPDTEVKGTVKELAEKYDISVMSIKNRALTGKGIIDGKKVVLVKPITFMNRSGESIRPLADYYKIDPESELIVISDDINLPPGQIRIRKKGSAGGHNGLKNIIHHLGNENFQRIRVGVGEKPKENDLADYVLGYFSKEEREIMDESIMRAVEAVEVMITQGADAAMNLYNKKIK